MNSYLDAAVSFVAIGLVKSTLNKTKSSQETKSNVALFTMPSVVASFQGLLVLILKLIIKSHYRTKMEKVKSLKMLMVKKVKREKAMMMIKDERFI